jgi:hypothetical protein
MPVVWCNIPSWPAINRLFTGVRTLSEGFRRLVLKSTGIVFVARPAVLYLSLLNACRVTQINSITLGVQQHAR